MKLLALGFVAFAACGGKTVTPSSNTVVPLTIVELGEITVYDGDDAMLKFHADGSTELGRRSGKLELKPGVTASSDSLPITWKKGPTIRPDGTVTHDGRDLAQIQTDGTILILRTGEKLPAMITGDKLVVRRTDGGTRVLEIAADGALTAAANGEPPHHEGRVEGANTALKRRTVLGFLALMFIGEEEPTVTTTTTTTEWNVP